MQDRANPGSAQARERWRLDVAGLVQGVGFRPFVHRLATAAGLSGLVWNDPAGVAIEVEGAPTALDTFLQGLHGSLPPHAAIHRLEVTRIVPTGGSGFAVGPSTADPAAPTPATILPDLAVCDDCLREMTDPADRRHRYPFISCVHCGPRYSILAALPYDRARTSMRRFPLCAACRQEYDDPASRRFHAETIACPDCGPELRLWDDAGHELARRDEALRRAVAALLAGRILALKGLGGFQLVVAAADGEAVRRLRRGKRRPAKPFALMVPDLASAEALTEVSETERESLLSPAAPIVLLRARKDMAAVAPDVAPDNPWLGIMLPYTPLHHLLLQAMNCPLVVTSGNPGDEPILADETAAVARLGGIADLFLVHDRPILRPVDDSVVRVVAGRELMLRRARGYAPLAIRRPAVERPLLALGGQQKGAIATALAGQVFLGPHIGNLSSPAARAALAGAVEGFEQLQGLNAIAVACDRHPDYHTSRAAGTLGRPVVRVPHHLAHLLACQLDNDLDGAALGAAWDGTGYGGDGTIWGGEFLALDGTGYRRAAHFRCFPLPGGDAAVREPRRSALGLLHALFGAEALARDDRAAVAAFDPAERRVLGVMLRGGVNAPLTSSVGRLFDAVAALLDLRQTASYEGEAAMALEAAAGQATEATPLPSPRLIAPPASDGKMAPLIVDWHAPLEALILARDAGTPAAPLAAGFHAMLIEALVLVARRVGERRVLLSGGCFQNALLTELAVTRLRAEGFAPYWHRRVPPNDGGLAAGQILFAANPLQEVG